MASLRRAPTAARSRRARQGGPRLGRVARATAKRSVPARGTTGAMDPTAPPNHDRGAGPFRLPPSRAWPRVSSAGGPSRPPSVRPGGRRAPVRGLAPAARRAACRFRSPSASRSIASSASRAAPRSQPSTCATSGSRNSPSTRSSVPTRLLPRRRASSRAYTAVARTGHPPTLFAFAVIMEPTFRIWRVPIAG